MSIPFSGSLSKSGGISAALKKQVRLTNLKAVKSVTAKYDPFNEKCSSISARGFMYRIATQEAFLKNPDCKLQSLIVNDRTEPQVTCQLVNGETVVFKTRDFTTLEVLQLFNKYVTPHGPVITEESPTKVKSKKAKLLQGRK